MALNIFKKDPPKINPAVPSRIKRMSREELIQWSDTTIMQLGRTFDDWRYHDQPIEDVMMSAGTLLDILQELCLRVAESEEGK